jgi:phosphate:Na+ symporter
MKKYSKYIIIVFLLIIFVSQTFGANGNNDSVNWFMITIGFFGGLALFLYGLEKLGGGMKKSVGAKMRKTLTIISKNRFIALFAGIFVTIVMQSSSTTSVILISFVQSGIMTFTQTIAIILGAYIGGTITTQIITLNITDYAVLIIALGFGLRLFTRKEALKNIGDVILGFGILFFGMKLMSDSMSPLKTYPEFIEILKTLENPILGLFIGLIITALVQSSGAFMGILIVLAQQNLISLEAGIALVIGANIGTGVTVGIAAINANRNAKRVAFVHILFKIIGAVIFVFWIPKFAELIKYLGTWSDADTSRQIANAHTFYNIIIVLIFIPFTKLFSKLIIKILPDTKVEEDLKPQIKYLDNNMLTTPAIAINLAKTEINSAAKILKSMLTNVITPFVNEELPKDFHFKRLTIVDGIKIREEKIDYLEEQITKYLIKIGKQEINSAQMNEIYGLISIINDIERIADIICNEILQLYDKKKEKNIRFSEQGRMELIDYHYKITKQLDRLIEFNETKDFSKAFQIISKNVKYNELEEKYRESHFNRLNEKEESVQSHRLHMELMDYFKQIGISFENIAYTATKTLPA